MNHILFGIAYLVLAPLAGGLLVGLDRIITARMQRRVGPPILQPFYDVFKLLQKKTVVVNRLQNPAMFCYLFFMIFTGFLFFEGSDILLILFVLTLSEVFLVLAASAAGSPFSHIGAERELILMMAYEPMVLITLVGIYKVTESFHFYTILASGKPLILYLPGIFVGYLYVLTMQLRKSPFDISYSHEAHQELVKGILSDLSGKSIAMFELAHWYEIIFLFGFIYLFFGFSPALGILAVFIIYMFEILVDNTFVRFRWELAFRSAWLVALFFGGGNLIILYALMGG